MEKAGGREYLFGPKEPVFWCSQCNDYVMGEITVCPKCQNSSLITADEKSFNDSRKHHGELSDKVNSAKRDIL